MVETDLAGVVPVHMTAQELEDRCIRLFGKKHWKKKLAELCGRDFTTVWRWGKERRPVPRYIETILDTAELQRKLEKITSSLSKQLK
jgi:hypothetical protein